jgi:hypothetical protein
VCIEGSLEASAKSLERWRRLFKTALWATSSGGESGFDGDPWCVAYRFPLSAKVVIRCGHGPPTSAAAFI